jgi:hypothetical protein
MHLVALRAFPLIAGLAWIGCGSSEVNFMDPDRGGTGGGAGSGGAQQSGTGGSQAGGSPGGAAGAPQGGAAGSQQGGSAAGGSSGSGGSLQGGAAGTASGGTNAGNAGTSSGGSPNGGNGGTNGSGGTGNGSFSCRSLMCVSDQQLCRITLPAVPGGATQSMCQPFPDSCTARNCSCFCNPPQQSPCGPASTCTCMDNEGRVQVTCAGA